MGASIVVQEVILSLGTPGFHIRVPETEFHLHFRSSFLLTGLGTDEGSNALIPVTHVGDQDGSGFSLAQPWLLQALGE